jgi:hypothetical protein
VSIIGSQANDRWELKIAGPNGFERSYLRPHGFVVWFISSGGRLSRS